MLLDARETTPDATVECDVCIAGGGAAGIAIATDLLGKGLSLALLESGGLEYEEDTQDLYRGVGTGSFINPETNYLAVTRARYLGGTTNHWDGWCRPLDPIDFAARPWVERSGWPIRREDLEPYYVRASPLVHVQPWLDAVDHQYRDAGPHPFVRSRDLEASRFHLSRPTRMGRAHRKRLGDAADARLLLHANAVEVALAPSGRAVESLKVAALGGPTFAVRAKRYVLACGGIENARLLLHSNRVHANGVGNANDLVGRFFSDHTLFEFGYMILPGGRVGMRGFEAHGSLKEDARYQAIVRLSERVQERERLLNGLFVLKELRDARKIGIAERQLGTVPAAVDRLVGAGVPYTSRDAFFGKARIVSEQTPNLDSRVTLADETDALGQRRARLDWRLGAAEVDSFVRSAELFARALGADGIGRTQLQLEPWTGARYSNHHMGTTRMAADPRQGVVDADCRVHGVDNLYVAGSSVFPTSGCSNPTFTILALALRLADHLRESLA